MYPENTERLKTFEYMAAPNTMTGREAAPDARLQALAMNRPSLYHSVQTILRRTS